MKFFAENVEDADQSLVGMGLTIRARELPRIDEFAEFAADFQTKCDDGSDAFDFGFLSETAAPLGLFATCHGHLEADKIAHFRLTLQRKPKSTPPQELQSTSDKLGGIQKGLPAFLAKLNGVTVEARVELDVILADLTLWHPPIKRRDQCSFDNGFELENEHFVLKSQESGVKVELDFNKGSEGCIVRIIVPQITVELGSDCIEKMAQSVWKKARTLFEAAHE